MRKLFLSQRLPRGRRYVTFIISTGLAAFLVFVAVAFVTAFIVIAVFNWDNDIGLVAGTGAILIVAFRSIYQASEFTFWNALEMAVGIIVTFLSVGKGNFYLAPLGFLMFLRSFSDGPEPRGWLPMFERVEQKAKLLPRRNERPPSEK